MTARAELMFLPMDSSKHGLLTETCLLEMAAIEAKVKAMTLNYHGRTFTYKDVCAQWNGGCYESTATKLFKLVDIIKVPGGKENLSWPLYVHIPEDFSGPPQEFVLPEAFGTPKLDKDENVVDVPVIRTVYFLNGDSDLGKEM